MKTTNQWIPAHEAKDLDAQKSADLAAHLHNMGFSEAHIEKATASVKASGAYDVFDAKPSSLGTFIQSVKTVLSQKAQSNVSVPQSLETELASAQ